MISRALAVGLLSAACVSAAATGSYLAVRQNASEMTPIPAGAAASQESPAVTESEGVVTPSEKAPEVLPEPSPEVTSPVEVTPPAPTGRRPEPRQSPVRRPVAVRASHTPVEEPLESAPADPVPANVSVKDPFPTSEPVSPGSGMSVAEVSTIPAPPGPERNPEPVLEEIVLPASSVIGLELDTSVTSERARVEDRVDARVTRDVYADGRLAIPAGSRVIGAVTLVERGGKVKERARLGIRFHTLVLAGGRQFELRSEPIYREGESPANDSSRKIGGAAIGGAVLGAIIGGKKGAIAGATAGAAGGTAAVMAGDRKAATLATGSAVTVKLTAPVVLQVER